MEITATHKLASTLFLAILFNVNNVMVFQSSLTL